MSVRAVEFEPTFEGWQAAARALLREGVPPADVRWRETASIRRLACGSHHAGRGQERLAS